ncbi:hypothetical protein BEN76_16735 (plasmid) [Acinetobacter soli]|uniref:Uncharacterized protein n=1 Tax=Acinetobacter soli TaxID=487316 RepID=A0A1P8ENC0_9GAMM|nr:hypothetical protein BEN76_16735 [Acinetobacter soli]
MMLELILKKLIVIVVLSVASLVSLYLYFKPEKNYSIAELQQSGLLNDKLEQKQKENNSEINTNIKLRVQSLKDFIDKAPFKQEDTHAILARNSEGVQKYLNDFSNFIDSNIMNNNNLTNDEKAKILWELFKEYNWRGDDNAFKAVIKDHLMYLKNPNLIPDITSTYSDISKLGEKSVNARHDLLEILNSIDIDPKNSANQNVIDTLSTDLRAINTRNESQNLSDMAIPLLYNYGKASGSNSIQDIVLAANNNPQASLSYMNSLFKLTLNDTDSNNLQSLLQSNMTQSTKEDLNHSIAFNLKEDGSVQLSTIDQKSLGFLNQYLTNAVNEKSGDNRDLQQVQIAVSKLVSHN